MLTEQWHYRVIIALYVFYLLVGSLSGCSCRADYFKVFGCNSTNVTKSEKKPDSNANYTFTDYLFGPEDENVTETEKQSTTLTHMPNLTLSSDIDTGEKNGTDAESESTLLQPFKSLSNLMFGNGTDKNESISEYQSSNTTGIEDESGDYSYYDYYPGKAKVNSSDSGDFKSEGLDLSAEGMSSMKNDTANKSLKDEVNETNSFEIAPVHMGPTQLVIDQIPVESGSIKEKEPTKEKLQSKHKIVDENIEIGKSTISRTHDKSFEPNQKLLFDENNNSKNHTNLSPLHFDYKDDNDDKAKPIKHTELSENNEVLPKQSNESLELSTGKFSNKSDNLDPKLDHSLQENSRTRLGDNYENTNAHEEKFEMNEFDFKQTKKNDTVRKDGHTKSMNQAKSEDESKIKSRNAKNVTNNQSDEEKEILKPSKSVSKISKTEEVGSDYNELSLESENREDSQTVISKKPNSDDDMGRETHKRLSTEDISTDNINLQNALNENNIDSKFKDPSQVDSMDEKEKNVLENLGSQRIEKPHLVPSKNKMQDEERLDYSSNDVEDGFVKTRDATVGVQIHAIEKTPEDIYNNRFMDAVPKLVTDYKDDRIADIGKVEYGSNYSTLEDNYSDTANNVPAITGIEAIKDDSDTHFRNKLKEDVERKVLDKRVILGNKMTPTILPIRLVERRNISDDFITDQIQKKLSTVS